MEFAKSKGWEVLDGHIYSDKALTGKTMRGRTGLDNLLAVSEMKPKQIDYILIDDTSRLSRDSIDSSTIIRDLKEDGIFIYYVSDQIDTKDDTSEDVIIPIYGMKDAMYSRDLAKKTKRGMTGQVINGYNPGGKTYGYTYTPLPDPTGIIDKKTRQVRSLGTQVSINSEEAKVLKTIFSMYATGYGLKAIASSLNEQDIKSSREKGNGWCLSAVRTMLKNPKYNGDWTWNKTKWVTKRKTGKRTQTERPKEEWVESIRPDLLIIEDELWNEVQSKFDNRKSSTGKSNYTPKKIYLLSGLLKCGICGANLTVISISSKGIKYGCSFNWKRGKTICPNNIKIDGSELEKQVIDSIKNHILNNEIVELLVGKVNLELKSRLSTVSDRQKLLLEKKSVLEGEIRNLINFISQGSDSISVKEVLQEKETENQRITFQLMRLTRELQSEELFVESDYIIKWIKSLEVLIKNDIVKARNEISKIIGELIGYPVSCEGETGLNFTGKPNIGGVLAITTKNSTQIGSGDRI